MARGSSRTATRSRKKVRMCCATGRSSFPSCFSAVAEMSTRQTKPHLDLGERSGLLFSGTDALGDLLGQIPIL